MSSVDHGDVESALPWTGKDVCSEDGVDVVLSASSDVLQRVVCAPDGGYPRLFPSREKVSFISVRYYCGKGDNAGTSRLVHMIAYSTKKMLLQKKSETWIVIHRHFLTLPALVLLHLHS